MSAFRESLLCRQTPDEECNQNKNSSKIQHIYTARSCIVLFPCYQPWAKTVILSILTDPRWFWRSSQNTVNFSNSNLKMVQITAMALTLESCALPKIRHVTRAVWVCFNDVKMEPEKLLFGNGGWGGCGGSGRSCVPCPPNMTDMLTWTLHVCLENPARSRLCSAALVSQESDHA